MIDTSALMAAFLEESGADAIKGVLTHEPCVFPAPVILEFDLVATGAHKQSPELSEAFIGRLLRATNVQVASFRIEDAGEARRGGLLYGKGRGHRARLNVVDLMVYGVAKRLGAPILCTGRDFAATDIAIHPASRVV